jgi:hypothetical protein
MLTDQIRRNKEASTLRTALGEFNASRLYIELSVTQGGIRRRTGGWHVSTLTFLHEQMHWLQFVGTASGIYSAYLADLQSHVHILDPWLHGEDVQPDDLPFLASSRLSDESRALWLACELNAQTTLGSRHDYLDFLIEHGVSPGREWISRASTWTFDEVLQRPSEIWEETKRRLYADVAASGGFREHVGEGLQYPEGTLFGARQLMECAARINEVVAVAVNKGDLSIATGDRGDDFPPPYGDAREIFYEMNPQAARTLVHDLVVCVLCDWALMFAQPPIAPLISAPDGPEPSAGNLYYALVREFDASYARADFPTHPADFVTELALSLYATLAPRVGVPTPIDTAVTYEGALDALRLLRVPEDMYTPRPERMVGIPLPADHGRLKFLGHQSALSMRLRLEHPGFFVAPCVYWLAYGMKTSPFDQIRPPLTSFPGKAGGLRPSVRDVEWQGFFMHSALLQDITVMSMYCDVRELAVRLKPYLSWPMARGGFELGVRAALGGSPASEAVLAEITR